MAQEILEFQWNRIVSAAQQAGFNGPVERYSAKGEAFYIEMALDKPTHVARSAKVTLYAKSAFPVTFKGEAVLNIWDKMGNGSKSLCNKVAKHLNDAGIAARAAKHNKVHVVAFDAGEWMNSF